MAIGTILAKTAVDSFFAFRDRGWEKALQDASDMLVFGRLPVADVNDMYAGNLSPQLTPGMDAVYGQAPDIISVPFSTR